MVRQVVAVAVAVSLVAGCTGGNGRHAASSSAAAGKSGSSAAATAGPVVVSGVSVAPTVTDKGTAAAPGRGIAFASHVFALGPSGPLPSSATVTIKLNRTLAAGTPVVAATKESASLPWTYLPATLSGDGASAAFTTSHFSLFGVLWLDTKDLAAAFKADFIDDVTGGLTQTVTKPTCQHESEARGDGYTVTSSSSDAVYWCFGIENGTRVLKVTVHRRYPMEIAHPNMNVISNHYNHLALSALSHLTSGNATIVEPGGTAVFNADLLAGGGVRGGESISTQMDGLGQSLYALQVGIETLTNILTRFGAGADKKAVDYFGDALQAHSCTQGLAEGTSGAIISGCLNPKQILQIYGVKGLLLAPVMAIGGVIAFFHSEYNALIDQFNHHDKYTITLNRAASLPALGLPNLFPYSEGFGSVKPARVFNGGDPTGLFTDITWDSWGGPIAHGHGTANYEPPNASVAESYAQPADFAAYDLTTCGGKPTYRHLAVWFPTHGERFDPETNREAFYDLCQRI